jgi:hypothetical protein
MPLLNYREQFAEMVESGSKHQTIRAMRKRPFKVGDQLYHYTGLRTKACRKLCKSECREVHDLQIDVLGSLFVDGVEINQVFRECLAWDDGFRRPCFSWYEMLAFFKTTHGLPFSGQLIKW